MLVTIEPSFMVYDDVVLPKQVVRAKTPDGYIEVLPQVVDLREEDLAQLMSAANEMNEGVVLYMRRGSFYLGDY